MHVASCPYGQRSALTCCIVMERNTDIVLPSLLLYFLNLCRPAHMVRLLMLYSCHKWNLTTLQKFGAEHLMQQELGAAG
jgi:hypothetical protein